jgi:hypothetical protein
MSDVKKPRYQIGDEVRLAFGSRLVGRVMEVLNAPGGSGRVLYTLYVPMDPEPLIWPVREEEIEKA